MLQLMGRYDGELLFNGILPLDIEVIILKYNNLEYDYENEKITHKLMDEVKGRIPKYYEIGHHNPRYGYKWIETITAMDKGWYWIERNVMSNVREEFEDEDPKYKVAHDMNNLYSFRTNEPESDDSDDEFEHRRYDTGFYKTTRAYKCKFMYKLEGAYDVFDLYEILLKTFNIKEWIVDNETGETYNTYGNTRKKQMELLRAYKSTHPEFKFPIDCRDKKRIIKFIMNA